MIGDRIRSRRTELGMSLRDLAEKVELTASFLSQIERDLADPSIKSLRKIADALSVPMLYFLAEYESPSPVVRSHERKTLTIPRTRTTYELLTPDLNRKMELFVTRLDPRKGNIAQTLTHPTEECVWVLEGRLCIQLDETTYELDAGDSIYFEGQRLRLMAAIGNSEAVFMSALTPAVF
jgi:transcriptional regulator with XRE-family HTH domain